MYVSSEQALDSVFLSYDKILKKLHQLGLTTKQGKEITELDLRKAIDVMLEKHPTCRWRSEKIRSRKYFILIEGYYWLLNVYFQKEKSLIDADINFFEDRIKQYEELLKVENNQNWWNEDMDIEQLCKYFNRKEITIRKQLKKCVIMDLENINFYFIIKLLFFVKVLNGYVKMFLRKNI